MKNAETVLELKNLSVSFAGPKEPLRVVREVSLNLAPRSRTAILGETGCGKSVMAMALFGLLPAGAMVSGSANLAGSGDLLSVSEEKLCRLRGDAMVLAPQNPVSNLDPVFSVGFQLRETLRRLNPQPKRRAQAKARELLSAVGFDHPGRIMGSYPHQLSGGMAQRVLLAMGLCGSPRLVVADEPTRGLDIEARDNYLRLTRSLYRKAAFLMITHDIDAARTCERTVIMYAGRLVEDGPTKEVLHAPRHPYTKGLLAAHPALGLRAIPGRPPDLSSPVSGCSFSPRCRQANPRCSISRPPLHADSGHHVRCFHA